MQFLVIGRDGKDKDAKARRLAVRQAHIALGDELVKKGNVWFGAALHDEEGEMIGSAFFMNFPTRKELDEYLTIEPYMIGNVWKTIEIIPCNTRNPWQFSHPKDFFEAHM
ncbi:MAG TPA: YciI family protein [Puia sp.]